MSGEGILRCVIYIFLYILKHPPKFSRLAVYLHEKAMKKRLLEETIRQLITEEEMVAQQEDKLIGFLKTLKSEGLPEDCQVENPTIHKVDRMDDGSLYIKFEASAFCEHMGTEWGVGVEGDVQLSFEDDYSSEARYDLDVDELRIYMEGDEILMGDILVMDDITQIVTDVFLEKVIEAADAQL